MSVIAKMSNNVSDRIFRHLYSLPPHQISHAYTKRSLVIVIKLKTKSRICVATILFIIYSKFLNKVSII